MFGLVSHKTNFLSSYLRGDTEGRGASAGPLWTSESGMRSGRQGLFSWRKVGSAFISVILILLLIDAGVETFLSGSPQRWVLSITATASIALLVVLWRRLGWAARGLVPLFALLGSLALSAWRPAGLTRGVVLLGQPTSTVLSIVMAASLLFAGASLLRMRHLPGKVRAVLSVLAIYGVGAFVSAALQGTSYADLFHGHSLWKRFPFWLQGAAVSTAVFLPAAVLIHVVGLWRVRGRQLRVRALQVLALGMSLVVALAGLISPAGPSRISDAGAPMPAVQPLPSTPSPELPLIREEEVGGAPQTKSSPQPEGPGVESPTRQHSAGAQPISLPLGSGKVPQSYRTALDKLRAGIDLSCLDPAALQARLGTDHRALASFVQEKVRFEAYPGCLRGPKGTLLAGAGNALDRAWLLATLLQAAGHRVRFAMGTLSSAQAEKLVRSGIAPQQSPLSPSPFLDAILERSASHFLLLGDALEKAGFRAPSEDSRQWEQAVRMAREHAWVQVDEQGRWVDIDPSPGAGYGCSLVPAQQVAESLDQRCSYIVEFRIDVETLREARRVQETVLEFRSTAAELAGVSVGLFHEVNGESAVPLLLVGDRLYKGSSFEVGGGPKPAGGLFPLPGLGSAREERGSLGGEWLHIRVRGPAGEHAVTYTIADALGPAARNAGPSNSETKTAVDAVEGVLALGVITGSIPPAIPAAVLVTVDDPLSLVGLARQLAALSFGYAAIRGLLPSSPVNPQLFRSVDFPNIVIACARPAQEGHRPRLSLDLTLKAYHLLRLPEDPLAAQSRFYDGLYNGVLDHTAERAIFGGRETDASVGALFEAAVDQDIDIRVLSSRSVDPGSLLTTDGRFRVTDALSAGRIVLLPELRPHGWPEGGLGWWSVDPATGWTEDSTESGERQGLTERGIQEKDTPKKIRAVCELTMEAFFLTAAIIANMSGLSPELKNLAQFADDIGNMLDSKDFADYFNKQCGSGPPLVQKLPEAPFRHMKKMPPPRDLIRGDRRWFPWRKTGRR